MSTYEWTDPKGNRWIASDDATGRDSELARNLEILRLAGLEGEQRQRAEFLCTQHADFRDRIAALEAENRELKTFVNGQAEEIDRLTKATR